MKKIIFIIVILEFFIFVNPGNCLNLFCISVNDTNEIINEQKESLNITDFVKEAEKYTKESMPGLNLNDLLTSAIKGDVDNVRLAKFLWSLLGKEVLNSAAILSSIIVIIVIHAILKSISESLGNASVAQITYYVQYILIVTLVMSSFSNIITMVKESIQNLVAFINMLIPILVTLMITTGNITSAGMLEPIIIFMVTFIGNFITIVIIPVTLISTALGIISQISEKVQIDRLSKFFKSSTAWILGVILTLFVGVASIEGSLSSSIDRSYCKNNQSSSF